MQTMEGCDNNKWVEARDFALNRRIFCSSKESYVDGRGSLISRNGTYQECSSPSVEGSAFQSRIQLNEHAVNTLYIVQQFHRCLWIMVRRRRN